MLLLDLDARSPPAPPSTGVRCPSNARVPITGLIVCPCVAVFGTLPKGAAEGRTPFRGMLPPSNQCAVDRAGAPM